jgi:RNA polymerase primary sigma factor
MDTLHIYLTQIASQEKLTAAEERELYRRIKTGDMGARNKLVCGVLLMVVGMVKQYSRPDRADFDELIQEANAALLHAAEVFDPDRGRWTTCAHWWIFQAIMKAKKSDRLIRVPAHHFDARYQESQTEDRALQIAMAPVASMNWEYGESETFAEAADPRNEFDEISDEEELTKHLKRLRRAMGRLNGRQRFVLEARLQRRTLREIGSELNVCKERVRQIEERAIGILAEAFGLARAAAKAVEA